jgi:hypothetical protein
MAIYSCSISNVSRARGSNSCATLSYITGRTIRDDRTGNRYGYGRQERVLEVGTLIPNGAPQEYKNPETLFNAVETAEKQSNARTAKKMIVALPKEISLKKQKKVIEEYIKENITSLGYACTYAIHDDGDGNPHAHILIANRRIGKDGKWLAKSKKEYALDEHGQRIPVIDPTTGQQKLAKRNEKIWKRVDVEVNPLNQKAVLRQLREGWATACNRYLSKDQQIDHRSYKDRGIDQVPTVHEGYAAREIERRGGVSDRCQANRDVKEYNAVRAELGSMSLIQRHLIRTIEAERAAAAQRAEEEAQRAEEEAQRAEEEAQRAKEEAQKAIEAQKAAIEAQKAIEAKKAKEEADRKAAARLAEVLRQGDEAFALAVQDRDNGLKQAVSTARSQLNARSDKADAAEEAAKAALEDLKAHEPALFGRGKWLNRVEEAEKTAEKAAHTAWELRNELRQSHDDWQWADRIQRDWIRQNPWAQDVRAEEGRRHVWQERKEQMRLYEWAKSALGDAPEQGDLAAQGVDVPPLRPPQPNDKIRSIYAGRAGQAERDVIVERVTADTVVTLNSRARCRTLYHRADVGEAEPGALQEGAIVTLSWGEGHEQATVTPSRGMLRDLGRDNDRGFGLG